MVAGLFVELRNRLENKLELFRPCDSAPTDFVSRAIEMTEPLSICSSLDDVLVALRVKEGRGLGVPLVGVAVVFLLGMSTIESFAHSLRTRLIDRFR